jgi:hypothetical protein
MPDGVKCQARLFVGDSPSVPLCGRQQGHFLALCRNEAKDVLRKPDREAVADENRGPGELSSER